MTVSQKEGLSFFMAITWFFSGDLHKSIDVRMFSDDISQWVSFCIAMEMFMELPEKW